MLRLLAVAGGCDSGGLGPVGFPGLGPGAFLTALPAMPLRKARPIWQRRRQSAARPPWLQRTVRGCRVPPEFVPLPRLHLHWPGNWRSSVDAAPCRQLPGQLWYLQNRIRRSERGFRRLWDQDPIGGRAGTDTGPVMTCLNFDALAFQPLELLLVEAGTLAVGGCKIETTEAVKCTRPGVSPPTSHVVEARLQLGTTVSTCSPLANSSLAAVQWRRHKTRPTC